MQRDGHAGTSEDYLYDASGERVLRRVVKSTGTQLFTYPFGLMDSTYNGSGVQQLENDYYTLAGRLIGERESGATVFLLTDELGSVLTSLSAVAGSAAVTSTQLYSPYGTPRYRRGTITTDKGFTGQYHDVSGLDYYHARYYDPVVGRFVSADITQGNAQGMDPYSYVGNNPETKNDPTGQRFCDPTGNQCGHPCADNCSPGDGGCSAHWHPPMAPCGGSGNDGGSGHPNPKPAPPPDDGTNHTCHQSAEACARGEQRRSDEVGKWTSTLNMLQLLLGGVKLVFDIISLFQDFGAGFGSVVAWIGDLISTLGDLGTFVGALAAMFNNSGMKTVGDMIGTVVSVLSGGYEIIKNTTWGLWALQAAYTSAKLAFAPAPGLILNSVITAAELMLGRDLGAAVKTASVDFFQAIIDGYQWHIDYVNGQSVDQYCGSAC